MQAQAAELSGYAGNHLRSSSYGGSVSAKGRFGFHVIFAG
jgi:hypothetical protein